MKWSILQQQTHAHIINDKVIMSTNNFKEKRKRSQVPKEQE